MKVKLKIYNFTQEGRGEFADSMVTWGGGRNLTKKEVKFTQNILKIFSTFFNLCFFELRENLLKILIK